MLNNLGAWAPASVDEGLLVHEPMELGRGIWLIRRNLPSRSDKNIYIMGQVPVGKVSTTINAGSATKATSTLISFPISEPLDINDSAIVNWDGVAAKGDHIRFYNNSDGKAYSYNWLTKTKKWYYEDEKSQIVTTGLILPRGQAFWYERARGNSMTNVVWNLDAVGK